VSLETSGFIQVVKISEHHRWKIGKDAWAHLQITGGLTPQRLVLLKKYVDLLEANADSEAERLRDLEKENEELKAKLAEKDAPPTQP
jgi:hypothetical protein